MEHALLNDESELGQELAGCCEECPKGNMEDQDRREGHYPEGADPSNTPPVEGGRNICVWPGLCWRHHASVPPNPAGVLKEIQSTLEGDRG